MHALYAAVGNMGRLLCVALCLLTSMLLCDGRGRGRPPPPCPGKFIFTTTTSTESPLLPVLKQNPHLLVMNDQESKNLLSKLGTLQMHVEALRRQRQMNLQRDL
ncbi:unnamed protein product [Notodromas monacha]|uniref:Uncharacterized protein n=1 Tax=Notodromas monacha TaxID=399045 RepID=A0A7R9BKW9_9CRUS|nr:unnamed protein product [Notodromas monacha]CAG0916269.1 unnamed protein product [Notodromas monacha]